MKALFIIKVFLS